MGEPSESAEIESQPPSGLVSAITEEKSSWFDVVRDSQERQDGASQARRSPFFEHRGPSMRAPRDAPPSATVPELTVAEG